MIQNNKELAVTQNRIAIFVRFLAQIRETSRPEGYPLLAGGYRSEVERMQREVLDYLTQHATQTTAKAG